MKNSLPRRTFHASWAALAAGLVMIGCSDLQVQAPAQVAAVRMTPDTVVLRVGDSARVRAAPVDTTMALLAQKVVTWSSSAAGVATVNDTGLVRAVAPGTATIAATSDGISGQTVAIISGNPATMTLSAGNGQTAAVNAATPVAPAVRLTDASGNPVAQAAVTFAVAGGGGTVTPVGPVLTNLNGVASATSWTMGPAAGANTLTATATDAGVAGSPMTFTATGTVGPPNAGQSTVTAAPLAILPSSGASFSTITVTVRDVAGSTITGATVTLASTGTGNIISQPTAVTDNLGRATGALSSSVAEAKTVSATVNGTVAITQTVTINVSATAAAGLGLSTQPAGATSNQVFATQPVVDVRDGFGNRVMTATDPITVTLVSGNGLLIGPSMTVNAVNGRATFSGLLVRGPRAGGDTVGTGPHLLRFTAPGFSAVDADTLPVRVSHAYNILDVYTRNGCIACHGYNYANTVNTAASLGGCAGAIRVVPGDTTNSAIYFKVKTASPGCGTVMPTGGLMSTRQIQLIRDWILQGALNN